MWPATFNIDYRIDVHGRYYSVPYPLLHELVDARRTAPPSSKSSIVASAWLPTSTAISRAPDHRSRPHAQGPLRAPRVVALAPGSAPSVPHRPGPSHPRQSPHPSGAIAPAWASCAWPRATAARGSKRLRARRCRPGRTLPGAWTPARKHSLDCLTLAPRPPRNSASGPSTSTYAPRLTMSDGGGNQAQRHDGRAVPRAQARRDGRRRLERSARAA